MIRTSPDVRVDDLSVDAIERHRGETNGRIFAVRVWPDAVPEGDDVRIRGGVGILGERA